MSDLDTTATPFSPLFLNSSRSTTPGSSTDDSCNENYKKAMNKLSRRPKALKTKTGVVKEVQESIKFYRDSAEQKALDRTVAMYIGASNAPYNTVQNKYFQIMLQSFQPKYCIPTRHRLILEMSEILQAMKTKITISMSSARSINFCADILWSKKGLTSSYLGLTAHYYSTLNQSIEHPTIAVREIPHPHTGQAICDLTYKIIKEWDIPITKVQFVITDNGSNMVKAFKSDQYIAFREKDKITQNDESDEESDDEFDETELAYDDSGDDDDDQILEPLEGDGDAVDGVNEFEQEETTHDRVMSNHGLKRLSCFSHTLQLVVAAFNKDAACGKLLAKAYKVVKQVSMSGKVTEELIAQAGKKLVSNSVTRWSSAYLVVSRLLEVKEHLMLLLVKHKLTLLQPIDWERLEHIEALLSKFARYTNVAGGENYPTLSLVIPTYSELVFHLEEMGKVPFLKNVCSILLSNLNRRFKKLIDPDDPDHDPIYIIATLFDVRYKLFLSESQTAHAKKECLRLFGEYDDSENDTETEASAASETNPDDDEPPAKRCAYDYVYKEIRKKVINMKELKHKNRKLPELQLDGYIQSTSTLVADPNSDPMLYWINSSHTVLAPFAIDILCAPASSASVERTFSAAGIATAGRRNRLAKENLEREVLLKKNEQYYSHIY